ncbi:MAG TPA: YbaB/EbfC family nucleoid-associated protein [bacterium]|nr:YbaB/EbfC family nucleoid-associated protein [bacterium]
MGVFSQLKQIKDLKSQAKQMQAQLSTISETVDVGWSDKVHLTINGNQQFTKIEVDQALLSPDKKNKLEELLVEGCNKAVQKVQKIMAEQMMKAEGGISGVLGKLKDLDKAQGGEQK